MSKVKSGLLTKILCRNGRAYSGKVFFILITCMLFLFVPFARRFIILNYNTNQILYLSNVKPGDRFSIIYTHSVNKSPIEDQFIVDNEYNIMLLKSIFKSFGAGIQSSSADDVKFEFFEDRIEVSYNNRRIDKLILSIGTIADHRFMMDGKDIKLNELSAPQSSICFSTDKITLFWLLKYTIINYF